MKIIENIDIWTFANDSVLGIPTNGYVTPSKKGVMGRGLAKQATERFPNLPRTLGKHILANGNKVGWLQQQPVALIAIPVKPDILVIKSSKSPNVDKILSRVKNSYLRPGFHEPVCVVPGFHCKADVAIIQNSLEQLKLFIEQERLSSVHLPLLGCGNGELSPRVLYDVLKAAKLPNSVTLIVNSNRSL